jgi:hypothetical protein
LWQGVFLYLFIPKYFTSKSVVDGEGKAQVLIFCLFFNSVLGTLLLLYLFPYLIDKNANVFAGVGLSAFLADKLIFNLHKRMY